MLGEKLVFATGRPGSCAAGPGGGEAGCGHAPQSARTAPPQCCCEVEKALFCASLASVW